MNELDKLCSPSYWCKRLPPDDVVQFHLSFIEKASTNTKNTIPSQVDIAYGDTERQKIDIIGTDLSEDAPILIFIHGGYWQAHEITRSSYHYIAETLHKNKIKTAFIGYDLCPDVTLPQIVRQIETAARKCLEYAKQRGSKGVYFMGHSAGAQLVAFLFTDFVESLSEEERTIVKGAILISGVFDLAPVQKSVINESLELDEGVALKMSPLKRSIRADGIAFYVIVGRDESPEFIKQAMEFSQKVQKSGFDADMAIIADVDHYSIMENFADEEFSVSKRIVDLIRKQSNAF